MRGRAIDMPVRKTLKGSANILIFRRIGLRWPSGQTSFRTKSDRGGCQSFTFLCPDRSGSTDAGSFDQRIGTRDSESSLEAVSYRAAQPACPQCAHLSVPHHERTVAGMASQRHGLVAIHSNSNRAFLLGQYVKAKTMRASLIGRSYSTVAMR